MAEIEEKCERKLRKRGRNQSKVRKKSRKGEEQIEAKCGRNRGKAKKIFR